MVVSIPGALDHQTQGFLPAEIIHKGHILTKAEDQVEFKAAIQILQGHQHPLKLDLRAIKEIIPV